jgi:hypothetical protein
VRGALVVVVKREIIRVFDGVCCGLFILWKISEILDFKGSRGTAIFTEVN